MTRLLHVFLLLMAFSIMPAASAEPTEVSRLPDILSGRQHDPDTSAIFFLGGSDASEALKQRLLTAKANKMQSIEFSRIDPTKYRVRIHNATNNFSLIFNERFDGSWNAYVVPTQLSEEGVDRFVSKSHYGSVQNDNLPAAHFWETWLPARLRLGNDDAKWELSKGSSGRAIEWPSIFHWQANAFANSWFFDLETLRRFPKTEGKQHGYYVTNADHSVNFEVVIEYWPQRLLYLAYVISALSIFLCLATVIYMKYSKGFRDE